jgi:AraC family transcriptional regulator
MSPRLVSQPQVATQITPAIIASLIESASACFDTDRKAAREWLLQANSLLRTQSANVRSDVGDAYRGRLATWQVKRVLSHIEAHLGEELRATDLAGLVNLSPSHFFRAFRISVGMSPCWYITRQRINFACERMRTTSEPLAHVALACGFGEQSTFCRVFLRIMGTTPGRWRRSHAARPDGSLGMTAGFNSGNAVCS